MCLAGCRDRAPVVIGHSLNTPTRPEPPLSPSPYGEVLRNVWCGQRGGCIALNHIAPPRLRDRDETTISVYHYVGR